MKLQKISTLLVFSMFAMVAKSQSFWTDTKMEVSPTRLRDADIIGLEKDANNFVKVYTYDRSPGYYALDKKDNGEPKKKGMAALKEMAKQQNAASKKENTQPNIGIIGVSELQANGNPKTDVQFVCPTIMKPEETYSLVDNSGAFRIMFKEQVNKPIDPVGVASKYPFLHLQDAPIQFAFIDHKGEGILGNKNLKSYVRISQLKNVMDTTTGAIKTSIPENFKRPSDSDANTILDYGAAGNSDCPTSIHFETLNVDVIWNLGAKESWDMYKNYKVIFYNDEGNVLKIIDKKFEFLRALRTLLPVYNEKRELQGVFVSFGPLNTLGKKSMKDPVENRVNITYFDKEGNEKFSYNVDKGDKGNARAFNPEYIIAKDDKFKVYNYNNNKMFKPVQEILTMDDKGISEPTVNTGSVPGLVFPNTSVEIGNNKTIAVTLNTTPTSMAILAPGETAPVTAKFNGININMFDWNGLKYVCSLDIKESAFDKFESIDYIGEVDGKHVVIISTDTKNFIATLGNDGAGKLIDVGNIEKKQPLVKKASVLNNIKNYYVNKEKKIAYFAYKINTEQAVVRGIAY